MFSRYHIRCPHCGDNNEFIFTKDPIGDMINELEYVCESCNERYSINEMTIRKMAIEKSRFYVNEISKICDTLVQIFVSALLLIAFLFGFGAFGSLVERGISIDGVVLLVENMIIVAVAARLYIFSKKHTMIAAHNEKHREEIA